MWQPDDTLLAETRATLDEQLRSLSQADCPPGPAAREAARGALEAAGTLAFLGLADEAQRALAGAGVPFARAARELVEGLDSEPLDRALGELLELAPELQLASDDELPEIEERIVDALGARDAMELLLAGAGLMPGAAPALGADIESSIVAFDELLARELWRLVPLGSRRAARAAWAAPAMRPRLWWWHRGSDLPHTALSDLGTAAQLIRIFPEAREELARLVQAERDLDALVRTPPRVATGGEKAGHVIALVELALRDLPANDRGRFARPLPVPEHQPQFAAAAPQSAGPMTAEWRALAGKWYAEIEWPAPPDDAAEREVVLVVYDAPEDAVSAVLLGLVRTLDGSGTRRRARFRIGELRARRAQELGGLVLLVGDPPYVELGALHDKAVPG